MAPKYPDEVNVFIVPHSRMKDLVTCYLDQMSTADFRSHGVLETLLPLLEKTFTEFKTHEHIENQFIMERLKQRLKMVNVTSQSVCNCHGDSRLVEILKLLRDGYTCTSKPLSERLSFGSQLQKAVSEFTETFIPHMEEEEEVFQPLLMKYFAYEELLLLKEQVIQQHEIWKEKLLEQKEAAQYMLEILDTVVCEVSSNDGGAEYQETLQTLVELTCEKLVETNKKKEESVGFDQLPQEMVTQIFSYLNPLDRTRCARVCKRWNILAYSPQLWKKIYPTNWAKGYLDFQYRDPYNLVETEWYKSSSQEDDDDEETFSLQSKMEVTFYEEFIRNCLMRIGDGVQHLVVAGGLHLSSTLLRSMLLLCPNIQHLDASYTRITDVSFKGLAAMGTCSRLEHLDLSGCRFVTDVGLERLGACFKSKLTDLNVYYNQQCGSSCCSSCKKCPKYSVLPAIEDLQNFASDEEVDRDSVVEANELMSPGLTHLNLSGCTSVTDFGLLFLLQVTLQTDSLNFLDLSGCSLVSGSALNRIAQCSTRLQPENLYYCNMIQKGPYPAEANGCQNLECPARGCCCFGQ